MRKVFLLYALVTPTVVYFICALSAGFDTSDAFSALVSQLYSKKQNLFMCTLLNMFPVLVLILLLWFYKKVGGVSAAIPLIAWCGFVPIAIVLLWTNFEVWPLFLPGRTYPGFPHGLEMIIGPGVFAPIGTVLGMLVGRVIYNQSTHLRK